MDIKIKIEVDKELIEAINKLSSAIMITRFGDGGEKPIQKETTKTLTKEDVANKLKKLNQLGKSDIVKKLLAKYEASKISEIKEEDYEAIYKDAKVEIEKWQ